jgi:hypothetical protein
MPVEDYLKDSYSWKDITLYAESVPHLLHWDLACLWVLKRPPELRPDPWRPRVEAWEKLLKLFLAGRLRVKPVQIPQPLLSFTENYGIREIRLLHSDSAADPVGVLSPIVFVRPLPEGGENALASAQMTSADLLQASHCLGILRRRLQDLLQSDPNQAVNRPIQHQLDSVLAALHWGGSTDCSVTHIQVDLLRVIGFAAQTAPPAVDSIAVPVADRGDGERVYVPRCSLCRSPLTHEDQPAHAREVRDDVAYLQCANGHQQNLPIEKLFLWRRSTGRGAQYVYWKDRRSAFPAVQEANVEWPPVPDVRDQQLRFVWNPGHLDGEAQRTALRLKFPDGAEIHGVSVRDDGLYRTLLVPGDAAKHSGLPIRWEWRDAWVDREDVWCDAQSVHYRKVKLRGLPFAFHWPYTSAGLSLRLEQELFPGIYPKQMHANWKPYRVLALSRPRAEWVVRVKHERGSIKSARDTKGWPDWVAVEDASGTCGTSWRTELPTTTESTGSTTGQARVDIGIDFGTTSTVVYFSKSGRPISTRDSAVHLERLRESMHWLGPEPPAEFHRDGWCFPQPVGEEQDPCLIPSALWIGGADEGYIRWAGRPPGAWSSSHGFKWDESLQNRRAHRIRFLQEVLFFSLPFILVQLDNPQARPPLRLGFAYPLAFDSNQRSDFGNVLRQLGQWLQSDGGFEHPELFCLNESRAAVRACGRPDKGELFLVADMGGHTLDVSLFPYTPPNEQESYHQIGSLDFGGESYLHSVTDRNLERHQREEQYWRLRSTIVAGRIAQHGEHTGMVNTLNRFHVMALEYLRVMLAAYLSTSSDSVQQVKVLLVGNGWRLRDLTAAGQPPETNFRDYFNRMVSLFEMTPVYLSHRKVHDVDSSKHWVAIGALKNAEEGGRNELDAANPYPDRLPAGKDITMGGDTFSWSDMVGVDGREFTDETRIQTEPCTCTFDSGPPAQERWSNQLEQAIPAASRFPEIDVLREWLFGCVWTVCLRKGPLQLILEKHWKRSL